MLLQFSVENFLSIKDKVTLSLVASGDVSLKNNIFKKDKTNLLKEVAIYGPNASGKTNILKAITYVVSIIVNSHKNNPGEPIDFYPFKLDKTFEEKPSSFEIIFEIREIKYIYGVSLDKTKVHKEYLYYYPKGHLATVFERGIHKGIEKPGTYHFTIDTSQQNGLALHTPENTLYLSKSANLNYEKTAVVVKWFRDTIREIYQETILFGLARFTKDILAKDSNISRHIKEFVSKADKGIVDLEIKEKIIGEDFLKDFPIKELRDEIIEDERKEVQAIHLGLDKEGNETRIPFSIFEEASGTRNMFNLAGPFFDVLFNGRILLVDELEASLHPHLVRYIVDLFNDPKYNKGDAQLIFASHNTYLLHPNILRRDQVWFTKKREDQSTELYSLFEYSPRKDENIEKGYLAGRYGAIPNVD